MYIDVSRVSQGTTQTPGQQGRDRHRPHVVVTPLCALSKEIGQVVVRKSVNLSENEPQVEQKTANREEGNDLPQDQLLPAVTAHYQHLPRKETPSPLDTKGAVEQYTVPV